jgi:hypothetical protein
MHRFFTSRRVLPAVVAFVGAAVVLTSTMSAFTQDNKSIFLTVLDSQGRPVTDLRQDEVALAERADQKSVPEMRTIMRVRKATQPLAIMLLADTSKATGSVGMSQRGSVSGSELVRDVRAGFSAFVKTMAAASPETKMELMEFGQAAVTITPMTNDSAKLADGIAKLFPKNSMPAVLLEAIMESGKILSKADTPRRAIVAMNVLPTDEQSRQSPNQMLQQVIQSGASFWAVSYNSGTTAQDPRGVVLDPLAKNTGGRREVIASQSALELYMTNIANALANQYEITFERPAGAQPQLLQVGVTRQGLSLHTSIYPPR